MASRAAGAPAAIATATAQGGPGAAASEVRAALTAAQPERGLILPALNSQPFRGML